jgi:hypothetical protein
MVVFAHEKFILGDWSLLSDMTSITAEKASTAANSQKQDAGEREQMSQHSHASAAQSIDCQPNGNNFLLTPSVNNSGLLESSVAANHYHNMNQMINTMQSIQQRNWNDLFCVPYGTRSWCERDALLGTATTQQQLLSLNIIQQCNNPWTVRQQIFFGGLYDSTAGLDC